MDCEIRMKRRIERLFESMDESHVEKSRDYRVNDAVEEVFKKRGLAAVMSLFTAEEIMSKLWEKRENWIPAWFLDIDQPDDE